MNAPDIRRSAGRSHEQEFTDQVAWASQVRKQREAQARQCGLRADWAREFSNSELEDYIAIAETVVEGRKPFNHFAGGLVLSVVIVMAILLVSLAGCGGGDPEPIDEAPTPRAMRGPHDGIRPVPEQCADEHDESRKQIQQWRDECDGDKS